jgi:hypothetical protein
MLGSDSTWTDSESEMLSLTGAETTQHDRHGHGHRDGGSEGDSEELEEPPQAASASQCSELTLEEQRL